MYEIDEIDEIDEIKENTIIKELFIIVVNYFLYIFSSVNDTVIFDGVNSF